MPGAHTVPQPRSPEGLRLCRWCKRLVLPPRKTFCSDGCVHEWRIRTDNRYVRKQVLARDRGICARCRVDTLALEAAFRKACRALKAEAPPELPAAYERLQSLGFNQYKSFWEANHKLAVADGGGECGLDNFETACVPCHKKITREQRARRAR